MLRERAVMLIRAANPDDAHTIAALHVASWQEAYRDILPAAYLAGLSVAQRQAMWTESLSKDVPQILVAEVDGQVHGFSCIGPCRDPGAAEDAFELWAIYLAPSHWHAGIGRALWQASRTALLLCGARSISLWVIADNARAIKFYRAAGFICEPETRVPFELGGVQIDEVRYVHHISIP